jgi:hypothetical protein
VELIGEDSLANLETLVAAEEELEGFLILMLVVEQRTPGEIAEKVMYYPIRGERIHLERSSGIDMDAIDLRDAENWFEKHRSLGSVKAPG